MKSLQIYDRRHCPDGSIFILPVGSRAFGMRLFGHLFCFTWHAESKDDVYRTAKPKTAQEQSGGEQ